MLKAKVIILGMAIAAFALTACNGDDEPKTATDFHVKYVVVAKPEQVLPIVSYSAPEGNRILQNVICNPAGEFSVAVGPVAKGFKASMAVSTSQDDPVNYLAIEVAEDRSPMVQKKILHNGVTLSYIVGSDE